MSGVNGDKARFGRQRKAKIRRRVAMRAIQKTLRGGQPEEKGKKTK